MDRRAFLTIAGLAGLLALTPRKSSLASGDQPTDTEHFSWDGLKAKAKALAAKPYQPPPPITDPVLAGLDYDQYRSINFRAERAIWRDRSSAYQMQLFHAGYLYREPVDMFLVDNGRAAKIRYERDMFRFGRAEERLPLPDDSGFSGFRLHAPINASDVFSEFLVFQGASYFRGRAKGQSYGLSARGLAIDTVQPGGEEFPSFRAYWVETPQQGSDTVTVYALLDSKSVAGAYRFTVSRSVDVIMDVECEIHPRRTLTHAGIAPFSSMFFFGPADHTYHDDFRPRVHDSDGLLIATSGGDWIWRPLVTGSNILYSAFSDKSPRGFGLMQREREFDHYQDINAEYQKRTSAWLEPLSDWGEGSVDLIELPTDNEYMDNVVAFWRPRQPMQAGGSHSYSYRLIWCWHVPVEPNLAQVVATRTGKGIPEGSRYFQIDLAGGSIHASADEEYWDYQVSASEGSVKAFTVAPNPIIDGKRIGIEYHPSGSVSADVSFQIRRFGKPVSEKWVYRWTP